MGPRLTDEQLEAALDGQLDPAFADHPVASFFREGAVAFDSLQPAKPSAELAQFFASLDGGMQDGASLDVESQDDDGFPIIQSASVIEPVERVVTPPKMATDSAPRSIDGSFRPAIQPLDEQDAPLWAPVVEPVFDEQREFPESPYELSNEVDDGQDAEVYWLDANRDPDFELEPAETSEGSSPYMAGRRAAVFAAIVAAIVGGAQATGTTDLLPKRVVDMAAANEGAFLQEGRKPSDPPPTEDDLVPEDDHDEPNGEDMDDVLPEDGKPNLRTVQPRSIDPIDGPGTV